MDGNRLQRPAKELIVACASPADPGVAEMLSRRPGVRFEEHPPARGAELLRIAGSCDVLVTRSWQRIDRAVLDAGRGRLRAVVQGSAGLDNIDAAAAAEMGIEVVPVDPGNATAVAELTLAAIVSLFRDLRGHWERTPGGRWPDREQLPDRQVSGKTLGIVGLGRVGTRVCRRALAFDMTVVAIDPYLRQQTFDTWGAVRFPTLDEMLPRCDVLSLHCPLTAETRAMIGARELSLLPRGAVLVNTARGGIVDERALSDALRKGRLAGAALDVFEVEPVVVPGLAAHPLVLATPHLAGHTVESHALRARNLAEALDALVERTTRGVGA